jgi:DnaK suppressor protein
VTDQDVRALLLAERDRVTARLARLERDFTSMVEAADSANSDDEHDPEGATIAFERQQVAGLMDQARQQLEQVEAALVRLDARAYGICQQCGQPIAPQRLEVRPTATTCIGCAQRRSGGPA